MLVGALAGVARCVLPQKPGLAVLITIIVGALMGLVVSYLTVSRRTNQVVTGLMINMLCLGATDMLFSMMSETRTNRCETFPIIFPEFMQNIPVIGKILFCQPISTWIAFVLPIFAAYFMYKTRWGLNVRAVGDNPKAAATAGLDVIKIKYQTVILSGIFAALGGCALTLAEVGYFSAGGMANGRGFIVMAACVVGGWDPSALLWSAWPSALPMRPRSVSKHCPTSPISSCRMFPYVVTVIAMAIMVKRSRVPKTWGAAYDPKDV